MSSIAKKNTYPKYDEDLQTCIRFLKEFKKKGSRGKPKYINILEQMCRRERKVVEISMDDLYNFENDQKFVERVESNAGRYADIFANAIDSEGMPKADLSNSTNHDDVMQRSRELQQKRLSDEAQQLYQNHGIPNELKRNYEVAFTPRFKLPAMTIREVTSDRIGSLLKIEGIVTRITEVRPIMRVAVYTCDLCGNEIYQKINSKSYTPLVECGSDECKQNKNKKPVYAQTKASKFAKFQELKLQELPEHVPVGNIPRSITVYCIGETTRQAACGDKITVTGIWLPIPYTGFRAMRAGLTANTYLQAMHILKEKKGYTIDIQDRKLVREVENAVTDPNLYNNLARSIAPEIYGMEDVKKALLLLLIAGVTKEMIDGMRIRGDINCLLMGDPGVAKSQLLKYVSRVAARSVYTTGKGSSGVGLTAAVMRDPVTRDMILEGGALVLADTGICCIDEFDKMEESDRTAIHEVMEQQTVSIAKAGITTTLNARTAILAAANPCYGRYNKNKTPEDNINLPAALLSRFDLVFVLVDRPDQDNDIALARHITHVHQHNRHPELNFEPYSADFMRAFIAKARTYEPVIPKGLSEYMIGAYIQMRQECLVDGMYDSRKIVPTPRTLLSILRLSQSLARVNFSSKVTTENIEEAIRLMKESKMSSAKEDGPGSDRRDVVSRIYDTVIKFMTTRNVDECRMADLDGVLSTQGFQPAQIEETIQKYNNLNVWQVSRDNTRLRLVSH